MKPSIRNFFAEGELQPSATVKESLTVQKEGSRKVTRRLKYDRKICGIYQTSVPCLTRLR